MAIAAGDRLHRTRLTGQLAFLFLMRSIWTVISAARAAADDDSRY
jgi:hypothetical protein